MVGAHAGEFIIYSVAIQCCSYNATDLGLSLLCSKIYLLFLPELPKNFTHCS